ncbi:fimbrial protein [Raoultella ornithinolytica]
MIGGLKAVSCAGVVMRAVLLVAPPAEAAVYYDSIYWVGGDNSGQLAGACIYTIPDNMPLSQPVTLVVDANTPVGSVIHSWGYGQFLKFSMSCSASGIDNSDSKVMGSLAVSRSYIGLSVSNSGSSGVAPYDRDTNNTGIKIRYKYRFDSDSEFCSGCTSYPDGTSYGGIYVSTNELNNRTVSSGFETGKEVYQDQFASRFFSVLSDVSGRYEFADTSGKVQSFSIAADLIKSGPIVYDGTPLQCRNGACGFQVYAGTLVSTYAFDIGGGGVTIVQPSCRLSTANYNIPMGLWGAGDISSPVNGPQIPVNLSLECSGKVDHVRFRFEDTGTTLSGNNNISLYDTAGGNKVDGLEIELLYNGMKVNVDNTTVTDTGSHGATKVFPASLPLYDSVGTAAFQARYVQSAAVTRAGADYTGPVTGKVNMYVTYD